MRLAFYLNGNVHQNWRLTASRIRVKPGERLFSNSWQVPIVIPAHRSRYYYRRSATTV